MAYLAPQTLRGVLAPEGAGPDQASAASLPDDQLQAAIDNAGSQVDSALGVRYTLPLAAPVPPVVVSIVQDIAAWLATLTWRRQRPLPAESPIVLRYTRATALLDQLAKGTMVLPVAEGQPSGVVTFNTSPDFFNLHGSPYPVPWWGPTESR